MGVDRGATRVGARFDVAGEATRQVTRLGSSTGARYDGLTDRVPVAPVGPALMNGSLME